ncbi:MAG: VWA domain-containing protein [Christensenellaceae bacterium]|nr:VWA domain-containing protein [Christensenellaceae bacterium]
MSSFAIVFSSPWFLLFLIPLVLLTFIPYFGLAKKFRRTRNRLTSLVLHLTVVTLSVFVLAGMRFDYSVPNEKNEIILLVDVSNSEEVSAEKRDEFVQTVLRQARYASYSVGVVMFGFDRIYAVPLTTEIEEIYDKYKTAELPDTSATDIAGALLYAKELFNNPESGKIVLITDGKETDNEAASVIRAVSAGGVKVDVANIPSAYEKSDVEIVGIEFPDYHVKVNEEFSIVVNLSSNTDGSASISLSDNGEKVEASEISAEFKKGSAQVTLKHKFSSSGLHELNFGLNSAESTMRENDNYCSYYYLQPHNKILIADSKDGESDALKELLTEEGEFDITIKNIKKDEFFVTAKVDDLREYDQIILNNVANSDMPQGFDAVLASYAKDYGGGILTVGGADDDGEAHAYVRKDMAGTVYQQILPVQAIDYTPPKGVVIIIDRSGSMGTLDDKGISLLKRATDGATSCLSALSERDYVGIMTLDSKEAVVLPMTPRTLEADILTAIASIEEANGGTVLPGALQKAGEMLRAEKNVDKRHIILVTDGQTQDQEIYESVIKTNYENETQSITMSIVLVGNQDNDTKIAMRRAAEELGHGKLYDVTDTSTIERDMREDLKVPQITEYNPETFNPIVYNAASQLFNGVEYGGEEGGLKMNCTLDGFFGVKLKKNAELILAGEYNVPLYAQWKYGKGYVGSFMCDLNGVWSSSFMSDAGGKRFIRNVVENLMPVEDIRPNGIDAEFIEKNYTNRIDVYAGLKKGEYISGKIISLSKDSGFEISLNEITTEESKTLNPGCYVNSAFAAANNYSKSEFVIKESGTYKIVLERRNAAGDVLETREFYKAFAYSKEYDVAGYNEEDIPEKVSFWAGKGKGKVIADAEDPVEIFESFETDLHRSFDPRTLFLIIAIALFLCDIAVRKFKFKWPHELIRDYREKKNDNKRV